MSRDPHDGELSEEVVAAIVAILARLTAEADDDEPDVSAWARSGRVACDWRGDGEWG
ncbi:MAG: hypothetical protein M9890_03440 [Thermomicrobiales bacterium]|nr:hypothetical protein [Thermomicrobiales bacterium]